MIPAATTVPKRGRRRAIAPCFCLAAYFLVTSCSVGPHYHAPSTPTAPTYSEPAPEGWKTAQPADAAIRAEWWLIFDDPVLNGLEAQVDPANQSLKAAEARYREARALVRLNRSNLYPTISAAPSISSNRSSSNSPTGAVTPPSYGEFLLPVDMNYEIDAWGRVRRSIAAAREESQAAAADLQTVRLSVQTELAFDYFELRSLDAQKELFDQTLVSYQKALDLTQKRYDGGLSSKAEVAQARTQLETTRSQDIGVAVDRTQFQHAIAVLSGRTPETLALPPAPLRSQPPSIPVGLPSQLLERRPDVAAAERRAAEANERIGIARAAFFPTLLITASGGLYGGSIVNWLTWPSRFWAVGPTVAQTLFDAGRRRAVSESAGASYDEAVANYRQAVLTAFQQVEDNLSTLRILELQSAAQRVAVDAANQSLRLSMERYKGGLTTYLDVVSAQTIALQDQSGEVDILRRRMDSSVLLIKALGGGWDVSKLPAS